jgi:hypothetical protein
MRTFIMMILAAFSVVALAGCPSSEDNCASTVGCGGDDDPGPGPDAGGGDTCSTDDGEACSAPMAIRADTPGTCDDPDYPVVCSDDTSYCWPTGTDCDQTLFACGTEAARCMSGDQGANCCGRMAFLCPSDAPYYCTEDGTCRASSNECASTCEYYGGSC